MNRPLITFLVATYNQEKFIREAIASALAQTYSPLEIIISDDCSKDDTFQIATEMVAAYKGPHTVLLNRNPTNLGISAHANRIMELTRGELVVAAAGDDISSANRTEVIFQGWEDSGRKATSIFSSYEIITGDGCSEGIGGVRGNAADPSKFQPLSGELFQFLYRQLPVVNGCTHAWSRKLFDYFGPLRSDLEDLALSFRSLAIGQLLYVHEPLVKYRRHGNNVSFFPGKDDAQALAFERRESRLRWVDEKTVMAYDGILKDIDVLHTKGQITAARRNQLRAEAQRVQCFYSVEREMIDGGIMRRLFTLARTAASGNFSCAIRATPRALPRSLYRSLYLLREKRRATAKSA
jgi:glycosyltransferase involved in cell wall biosynthesis